MRGFIISLIVVAVVAGAYWGFQYWLSNSEYVSRGTMGLVNFPIDNRIIRDSDENGIEKSAPNDNLKTFSNEFYGFAFDFDKDYYWDAQNFTWPIINNHSGRIYITSSQEASEMWPVAPLPDTSDDVLVELVILQVGYKTIEQFAFTSWGDMLDDPYRQTGISMFQAQNITGTEYFIGKSTHPEAGTAFNYPERYILFKYGEYIYFFEVSGNPQIRNQIVSSFRTI